MLRVVVSTAIFLGAGVAQTNAQPVPPQFEAASIHPTDPNDLDGPSGCLTTTGLLRCSNVTLERSIIGAYGVGPDRVAGGPAWIRTDRFQITARSEAPVGDKGLMPMFQTLLAERFKLVLHRESRPGDGMILRVDKNGPKLQPDEGGPASYKNMHDHLEATKMTIGELAGILSRNLNLLVVDGTGLTGTFSFALHWNTEDADGLRHDEAAVALRPQVSAAVARQLGLTLTVEKMPIEILVIDHVEKPSEN